MTLLKIGIFLGLLSLTCGQILFWRRRDNILGYLQAALFLSTFMFPIVGTDLLERFEGDILTLYAQLIILGGFLYLAGLFFGAPLGNRPPEKARVTFVRPIAGKLLSLLISRGRILAIAGGITLTVAYLLMGFAPLLTSDRHSAKFGVGAYAAGAARGALPFRLGLALASTALPVMVIVFMRNRRPLDLALIIGLLGGLALSLSRGLAFGGVLMVIIAVAAERRVRPSLILTIASLPFFLAAIGNELLFGDGLARGTPIPARLAASAPDVYESLGFLGGFEASGEQRLGWGLIAGGLSIGPGYYDPSEFALRTLYGEGAESLPSGGLRLPAPIWGYVSFGFVGAATWSFFAGFFAGWGTVRVRRLLDRMVGQPHSSMNMVVAAIYFTGTYGVLSTFYFATTAKVLAFALALYLGRVLVGPTKTADHEMSHHPPNGVTPSSPLRRRI